MIQPVNAFSPRAGFRGSAVAQNGSSFSESTRHKIALINAGGITAATGGLTTLVARSHTSSWANAIVLGLCGALLSFFFMTPQLVKSGVAANDMTKKTAAKENSPKFLTSIKEFLRPAKKSVQFKHS